MSRAAHAALGEVATTRPVTKKGRRPRSKAARAPSLCSRPESLKPSASAPSVGRCAAALPSRPWAPQSGCLPAWREGLRLRRRPSGPLPQGHGRNRNYSRYVPACQDGWVRSRRWPGRIAGPGQRLPSSMTRAPRSPRYPGLCAPSAQLSRWRPVICPRGPQPPPRQGRSCPARTHPWRRWFRQPVPMPSSAGRR